MKELKIDHIAKVEGHANLRIKIDEGKLDKVELGSVEGSRFFEGILNGRDYSEAHLIVQRICGICSVSHTLVALQAIEDALDIEVSEQTRLLRELMEIGAMIQSHSLHVYLLALPDYLGFSSAIEMASKYKEEVQRGLMLKKLGNEIDKVIGGREMHPVTTKVGGFTRLPSKEDMETLLKLLEKHRIDAAKTADLFASLDYPDFMRRTEYLSLKLEDRYPLIHGDIMFSNGLEVPQKDYQKYLKETVVPYSTAKFTTFEKRSIYVGALARINNNFDKLSKNAQKAIERNKITFPSFNPFHNNYAQAIEIVHYLDRAIEIIKDLKLKEEEPVVIKPKAGKGIAIVEAPRGLLIHEFTLDNKGKVVKTNVVTPTAQNLKNIEDDMYKMIPKLLEKTEAEIVFESEKLVRAYDPCISCSAHFLKIDWERR